VRLLGRRETTPAENTEEEKELARRIDGIAVFKEPAAK
jgi:hypothetical protein